MWCGAVLPRRLGRVWPGRVADADSHPGLVNNQHKTEADLLSCTKSFPTIRACARSPESPVNVRSMYMTPALHALPYRPPHPHTARLFAFNIIVSFARTAVCWTLPGVRVRSFSATHSAAPSRSFSSCCRHTPRRYCTYILVVLAMELETPSSLPSTGRTPLLARSSGAPVCQPLARGSIAKNGDREGT